MARFLRVVLDDLDLTDDYGSDARFVLESFDGWGSPASTRETVQKARAHGGTSTDAFFTPRPLTFGGKIRGTSSAAVVEALDALIEAASIDDVTLEVQEGGLTRYLTVHRTSQVSEAWLGQTEKVWSFSALADDPRKVGDEARDSVALATVSGGLTLPTTLPLTLGSTVVGGSLVLSNEGNMAGPLTVSFEGPITSPTVLHTHDGVTNTFQVATSVPDGQTLVVDVTARTVMLGDASRYGFVTQREWPSFPPGVSTYTFAGSEGSGSMTVEGRPAWQ